MLTYPSNHSFTFSIFLYFQHNFFKKLMEEMKLDLSAPLLSVRRITPKNERRSQAVGSTGLVPFTWEQTPGKPKSQISVKNEDQNECKTDQQKVMERDEKLSDEESFIDCSVSDYSDVLDAEDASESILKNREAHEFIMDRFLPAAKAMTSPQKEKHRVREKVTEDLNYRRTRVALPFQHTAVSVSKFAYDRDLESYIDEEDDCDGGSPSSTTCGLIPRIFLNPIPGIRARYSLQPRFHVEVSDHRSLTHAEREHSWDEVYKYKLGQGDDYTEDESKLTSESNQLTNWSDSQTLDEYSYHHSPHSPFDEEKGSLQLPRRELKARKAFSFDWCEKIGEKHGKVRSLSPSIERTLCAIHTIETCSSKSSSVDGFRDTAVEKSEPNFLDSIEMGSVSSFEQLKFERKLNNIADTEKNHGGFELPILPLPLPQSPSDSWLKRTLPSVTSKSPFRQSSIQVQHRKQALCALKDVKRENDVRTMKREPQQTRFAQVHYEP